MSWPSPEERTGCDDLETETGAVAFAADVTIDADVQALAQWLEQSGPVHSLVHVAGGARGTERIEDARPDDWRWMFEVNALSAQRLVAALLPLLRAGAVEGGHADTLFVTSTAAQTAYAGGAGYNAAKAAEAMVAHGLRLELNGEPIRVIEVAPGMVRTDEFTLNRLGGDREAADAVYAGVESPLTADDVADVDRLRSGRAGACEPRPHHDASRRAVGAAPARPRAAAAAHRGLSTAVAMTLDELAEGGLVDPGWARALAPVGPDIAALGDRLRAEVAAGRHYLPAGDRVLRAFQRPLADVKVLIVGQDPYPTPGHPIGLSFAVDAHVRPLPRSLSNIYQELDADLGIPRAPHGDLSAWSDQGVMLLNRVLTVAPGAPASHRGWGWEKVTEHAIRTLVARDRPLVAVLWGRDASNLRPLLGGTPIIESAHPSPLSASRGFFGSRPFSRANQLLEDLGAAPVDWRIPPAA